MEAWKENIAIATTANANMDMEKIVRDTKVVRDTDKHM